MKTKAIRAAARTYHQNRIKSTAENPWSKEEDQKALFGAMGEAGLGKLHAMAGTHIGTKPNGKLFVVDIGDEISFKTYKDSADFFNSFPKVFRR